MQYNIIILQEENLWSAILLRVGWEGGVGEEGENVGETNTKDFGRNTVLVIPPAYVHRYYG